MARFIWQIAPQGLEVKLNWLRFTVGLECVDVSEFPCVSDVSDVEAQATEILCELLPNSSDEGRSWTPSRLTP